MTASLQIKKGYYYVVLHYKDANGKTKLKWKSTGLKAKDNKRKAEQIMRDMLENEQETVHESETVLTMPELIRQWLEVKKLSVRPNSYKSYMDTATLHVIPYFETLKKPVRELAPVHIQRYYTAKSGEGLNPGSLTRHRTIIRDSLNYAIQTLEAIKVNPADRVSLPKGKKKIPNFYKQDELKILFQRLENESIESAVRLAVYFGLRRSEVLGLRWCAIDWQRKAVEISHTAVRNGTDVIRDGFVKEQASYRTIPLFPEAEAYLKALWEKKQRMQALGSEDSEYICVWDDGRPLDPDYVTQRFGNFLKAQGLRHIRFHDLRHSTASLLINNKCTLKQVQEYLGHAKAESTEIYAHMLYESKLEMADKLNNALSFNRPDDMSPQDIAV